MGSKHGESLSPTWVSVSHCGAAILQLLMARSSGLRKSNGLQLHQYPGFPSQGMAVIRDGSLRSPADTRECPLFASLSPSQRPCFHCPLCTPLNRRPWQQAHPVSGHTGGNLLEPGWGRMFSELALSVRRVLLLSLVGLERSVAGKPPGRTTGCHANAIEPQPASWRWEPL